MKIGDLTIDPVFDGLMRVQPTQAFKGTTDDMWAQHSQFLDAEGKVEMAIGGFLVRGVGDRVTLVDNGIGEMEHRIIMNGGGEAWGGKLLESLNALGVKPEDVTDVVFTHLHFDHVGWSSVSGNITFPNATYRCDARDWEHFIGPDERISTILNPVKSRVETWDSSGPILPGLDSMTAPGHTPGSTIIVLSSGNDRGLLLGDVVHCPVELIDDEWAGLADLDPALAKRTRNALARELEGTDTPAAAAHFPGMVFGRLMAAEGRRRWVV